MKGIKMAELTLNFSLKPHSKVNIYIDGKLADTARKSDTKRITVSAGEHSVRLVQYRGKRENSPCAFGAVPYFAGGTLLNGDGTKSSHLIPWRATVHYFECAFSVTISGDASIAVLANVEKKRGFIGIDNHFLSLKLGTVSGTEIENYTSSELDKKQRGHVNFYQRIILLLTYIPALIIVAWQYIVGFSSWDAPARFGIVGRVYVIIPSVILAVVILRITHFLLKMRKLG